MTILFHKINRFLILNPTERQVFLRAMVLLPTVSFCVKFLSVKSTLKWLSHRIPFGVNYTLKNEQNLGHARRTAGLMHQAIYYSPIKGKCLSQSLVLWHLLHCQMIESEVRIGVHKNEAKLPIALENINAHAWVEYQGEVLNDQPDVRQRYNTFERVLTPPKHNEV